MCKGRSLLAPLRTETICIIRSSLFSLPVLGHSVLLVAHNQSFGSSLRSEPGIQLTCLTVGWTYKADTESGHFLYHSATACIQITLELPHCSPAIGLVFASVMQPEWLF